MANAYDVDDPRNWDDDRHEEPLCPECGGPCRWGCERNPPRSWDEMVHEAEAYLATREPDLQALPPVVCAACGGTGVLSFTSHPYGEGWGHVTETIPCACRAVKP